MAMDLKDFIKEVLTDIVGAVEESQQSFGDKATILPYTRTAEGKALPVKTAEGFATMTAIDFDVALTSTTSESTANGKGGGVQIAGIVKLGGKSAGETSDVSQSVSRIRFTLPILLPHSAPMQELFPIKEGTKKTFLSRGDLKKAGKPIPPPNEWST